MPILPESSLIQTNASQSGSEIHANILQLRASDPDNSVWVSASAGSGKTTVLTNRILKLLLPNKEGIAGCHPDKILAITFTKAGASEMALRIQKRLGEWAICSDNSLEESLQSLFGYTPTNQQKKSARQLFAKIIDTAGGLKIMTIHSFCQSVLARFPLEADLTPGFTAIEEDKADAFLQEAFSLTLKQASEDITSPLQEAVTCLSELYNQEQLITLIKNVISERSQLETLLHHSFGIDGLYTNLCKHFGFSDTATPESIRHKFLHDTDCDEQGLWQACKVLAHSSGKKDNSNSVIIQKWLEANDTNKESLLSEYIDCFLTTKYELRDKIVTKHIENNNPIVKTIMLKEAERILTYLQNIKALDIVKNTYFLLLISHTVLSYYQQIKSKHNALDFDDLILFTLSLFEGKTESLKGLANTPSWIRYKLDKGINHLLVDEAQDTNTEQWKIVQILAEEFFNDSSYQDDINRSLFVVGDEKQSIFSFQRASPHKFNEVRDFFRNKIHAVGKNFEDLPFITSYRTTQPIIDVVDTVFSSSHMRRGLGIKPVKHTANRRTQAGLVELWPAFNTDKSENISVNHDIWTPPILVEDVQSNANKMAEFIAKKIHSWIDKEFLPARDRTVQAGDIMILVKSRTEFIDQLIRQLKLLAVPVSGVDRMILRKEIAIQDLYASMAFSLLPEDDLNLACLLKSPFIGMSEEDLFTLCYNRGNTSLWQRIQKSNFLNVIEWLNNLLHKGKIENPYAFLNTVLYEPCPSLFSTESLSGIKALKLRLGSNIDDPIEELLSLALSFSEEELSTLQQFYQEQNQSEEEIKRELQESNNAVRIMTIHASKGLESPIVILPDTIHSPFSNKRTNIIWPDKTGHAYPYLLGKAENFPSTIKDALHQVKNKEEEEYQRLLYVAMTRAEDRLYIGGYSSKKNTSLPENCWYDAINIAFENLEYHKITDEGGYEIKRYKQDPLALPDKSKKFEKKSILTDHTNMPDWLYKKVDKEESGKTIIRPSLQEDWDTDYDNLSPTPITNQDIFLRGNITHKLLQFLPDRPENQRELFARKFLAQPIFSLSAEIQEEIWREIEDILHNITFKAVFGKGSRAEVSVTGILSSGEIVSGQIDRLIITDTEILIVDYKTNRMPPKTEKDIPSIYRKQLRAYALLLHGMYPEKTIKTALLWTQGARFMEIAVL